MARRVRLRTVLILVNLFVLALPLAGVQVLRIYESALVRQTESELIAQGVAIASFYRASFRRLTELPGSTLGGEFLASHSRPSLEQVEPATEPWQPRPALLDLADSEMLPPLADPLRTERADALASLVGETLTPVLRDLQQVTLAAIRVVDFNGVIVASTASDDGLSLANGIEVQSGLAGTGISRLRERELIGEPPALSSISRGGLIRVFVSTPIIEQQRVLGAVLLSRTPANIFQALYGKRVLLMEGLVLLMAVVIAIGYLTSRTILKPLRDLSSTARQIAAGDSTALQRIRPGGTAEIAQLSESIHDMGHTLQRRADYLRDFARHLSHEFKTPLAAIRGAVEVLEDHGQQMNDAERDSFLGNIHADVERLNQLTERLLDLARAEMSSAATAETTSELSDVLARLDNDHGVSVCWTDPPPIHLAMEAASLDAVLGQLAENAREHAGDQANITIEVRRVDGHVDLLFADDGAGVSPGNRERIFQPFFTTARDDGGTGLGLSIVRALLEGPGGEIELLDVPRGSTFRLRLPVREGRPQAREGGQGNEHPGAPYG
jgi:signal transduction histidine kinase